MTIERRKYVRFIAQDNAFAALRFKKVGKVNDISIKGLAFSYLSETIKNGPYPYSSKVDIFLSENGFHLSNVPCKVVYDIPGPTSGKNHSVIMYRCGLEFSKLGRNQSELLEFFIKKHTIGVLSS